MSLHLQAGMAQLRISDRWLAVGLLTVAYFSACLITWHKSEGERLDTEAKETERQSDRLRPAQDKSREKTEDGTYGFSQYNDLLHI